MFIFIFSHSYILRFYLLFSNLLNSGKLDFDEYYLKNDFLSVGVNIIYEEITEKQINPLLLFQLNLNTHSKHVSNNNITSDITYNLTIIKMSKIIEITI